MVDAVIKVGGSLATQPEKLRALCTILSQLSKKYRLLIVPGGGEFTDAVRVADKRFSISNAFSHKMAILGMDQYGLLIADITPNSSVICMLEEAEKAFENCRIPIFLPSTFMFTHDPLENSWDVTSDSISAYIATQLGAAKLILVKDIDGIFTADPKKNSEAKLIPKISAGQLAASHQATGVDRALPKLLIGKQLDCYVINGLVPQRVEAILEWKTTVCTQIVRN